jgi:hypothetical protein
LLVPEDPDMLCATDDPDEVYVAGLAWLGDAVRGSYTPRVLCCVSFVGEEVKVDMMPSAVACADMPMLLTANIRITCVLALTVAGASQCKCTDQ